MGKPGTCHGVSPRSEHIGPVEGTEGIETSQYLEERKATATPPVAASEKGSSLNRSGGKAWWRCRNGVVGSNRRGTRPSMELQTRLVAEALWKGAPQRVTDPYAKRVGLQFVSRVSPGT